MIVCLHKLRRDDSSIAREIPCDVRTVHHWVSHYGKHGNVDDEPRSGRKRKTTSEADAAIKAEAEEKKCTTPRRAASSASLASMSPLVPSTAGS